MHIHPQPSALIFLMSLKIQEDNEYNMEVSQIICLQQVICGPQYRSPQL